MRTMSAAAMWLALTLLMMWPFFAVAAAAVWTETVATAAVTAGPSVAAAAAARPAKKQVTIRSCILAKS